MPNLLKQLGEAGGKILPIRRFHFSCRARPMWYAGIMNLDEIKKEVAELPREDQNQLAAYLVHLRHEQDSKTRADITAKIDDKDPAHWVSLHALQKLER